MIKNKKAESLVGIVISVFILSFTMLGILNILGFSTSLEGNYRDKVFSDMVKWNSENIVQKLNLPKLENNEIFYIKKDNNNKNFIVLTGTTNEEYKYIDFLGNKVDPNTYEGPIYIRTFQYKSDILKHVIYPNEISNISFWYDATNINGNNNDGLSDGDEIDLLKDISGNGNDAYQNSSGKKPKLKKYIIKDKDSLKFDGIDDRFLIDDNSLINTDNSGDDSVNGIIYNKRSLALVIKTGDDVNSDQVIYEEGGTKRGYNFMIHNGNLYAGVWNTEERDDGHKYKSVDLGEILPNTIYFIIIIQDSSHGEYAGDGTTNNNFEDDLNRLKIYLNGILVSDVSHVDPQVEHEANIGIAALTESTVYPRSPYNEDSGDNKYHFKGYFGELIEWNSILSNTEIKGIQNYFKQKWYNKVDNVKFNIIKTNISKYNNNF